tara:strand:- start:265 stop:393 length:129 start_codon:yes stop_codon:yes gene_type:complete
MIANQRERIDYALGKRLATVVKVERGPIINQFLLCSDSRLVL